MLKMENKERNYRAEIIDSSKELSAIEKVKFKDTSDCIKLDEVLNDTQQVIIEVDSYVVLQIHNDNSDDKEYNTFIIIDKEGNKYSTGSTSFFNSFMDIMDELKDVDEKWELKIYKVESKNYKGKFFISCSVA